MSNKKVSTKFLTDYLDNLLCVKDFKFDHSNNGLQIEACENVHKVFFAVDAAMETFTEASRRGANLIVVHHGLSWGSEPKRFTGIVANRLQYLFEKHISLYAVHLPLDAHPVLGHNACIADVINLRKRKMFFEYDGVNIGIAGELQRMTSLKSLCTKLNDITSDIIVYGMKSDIKKIGIVSGGGGSAINVAANAGLDCLITGEITHCDYHFAIESGIAVITLGHYRSEIPGLLAVMKKVESELGVFCEFIDIPTGL
jgi:dinuclear metal center YbgI/SA1388 family protein